MKLTLEIQNGNNHGKTLTLRGPEAVLGRAHGSAVRIPSGDVSRKHCRLCITANKVTLEDLNSLNGTYLNARRIEGIREVRSGDRIRVGPVTFLVDCVQAKQPAKGETDPLDELEIIDTGVIDAILVEEPAPPPGKKAPAANRPDRETVEDPFDLVSHQSDTPAATPKVEAAPKPPAKPTKPAPSRKDKDDLAPLGDKRPQEDEDTAFVDYDQAWKVPEPSDLRDILQCLEHGQVIEDEDQK
jgi:predicted component of type VI protein secretion system